MATKFNPLSFAGFDLVGSGGGGAVAWGDIGGTLSNQTDLNTALGNKYDASNPDGFISDLTGFTTDDLTQGTTNLYDQVVSLTEGTNITITGTYPNFTINSTGGGVSAFTDLSDTPANYTGAGLCVVRVNVCETGLEFAAGGGAPLYYGIDSVYIQSDGAGDYCVNLVNDANTTSEASYYGTDSLSNKGFYGISGLPFLKLDQTTPQTVINGQPVFECGLQIGPTMGTNGILRTETMSGLLEIYSSGGKMYFTSGYWSSSLQVDFWKNSGGMTPSDGDVLTYNSMTGASFETPTGGSGSPYGGCNAIQFADPTTGTSFCGTQEFTWDGCAMTLGCLSMGYHTHIDYSPDGHQLSWYGADDNEKAYIGWFDGENPYTIWGYSCSNMYICMNCNSTYISGGDVAYISLNDNDNAINIFWGCGFDISGSGYSWAISYCYEHPNNVKINHAYYLPECAPTSDGQVIKYDSMSGVAVWGSAGGGGSGTASGCAYSIQYSDGTGGFCDGGTCNSVNYFEYDGCKSLNLLGADYSGFNQRLKINNDSSNWNFISTDTSYGSCGAGFLFQLSTLYNTAFTIQDTCCDSFRFDALNQRAIFTNYYSQTAKWGISSCGAFFGVSDCSAPYINFGQNGCCQVDIYNGVYNDNINWKDYATGFSGSSCDLVWTVTNGCTYGYTQYDVSGIGLGAVFNVNNNNDGAAPMIFAQNNCEKFRIACDGFICTTATMNILGGWCMNGTAPAPDGTYSVPTSITIQNGIITAIS